MTNITPRQMSYMIAKAQFGLSYKQIATLYGVTEQSVDNMFWRMRQKIGARNTPHAAYLLWTVLAPMLEVVANPLYSLHSSAVIPETQQH